MRRALGRRDPRPVVLDRERRAAARLRARRQTRTTPPRPRLARSPGRRSRAGSRSPAGADRDRSGPARARASRSIRRPAAAGSAAKTSSVSSTSAARSVAARARRRRARELEEVGDELVEPPRLAQHDPHEPLVLGGEPLGAAEQLDAAGDRRERVAELVREPGGDGAEVGEPLRALHRLLHRAQLGEVLEDDRGPRPLAAAPVQGEGAVAEEAPLPAGRSRTSTSSRAVAVRTPGTSARPAGRPPARSGGPVICSPARFRKVTRPRGSSVSRPLVTDCTIDSWSAVTAARSLSLSASRSPVRRSCSAR